MHCWLAENCLHLSKAGAVTLCSASSFPGLPACPPGLSQKPETGGGVFADLESRRLRDLAKAVYLRPDLEEGGF